MHINERHTIILPVICNKGHGYASKFKFLVQVCWKLIIIKLVKWILPISWFILRNQFCSQMVFSLNVSWSFTQFLICWGLRLKETELRTILNWIHYLKRYKNSQNPICYVRNKMWNPIYQWIYTFISIFLYYLTYAVSHEIKYIP